MIDDHNERENNERENNERENDDPLDPDFLQAIELCRQSATRIIDKMKLVDARRAAVHADTPMHPDLFAAHSPYAKNVISLFYQYTSDVLPGSPGCVCVLAAFENILHPLFDRVMAA